MNEFLLPGLVKRRAVLAGQLQAANAEAARLHADLAAVDAVIRQLDPAYKVDAIAAKRPRDPASSGGAGPLKESVGRALKHQRSLGAVRNPAKDGRAALWELAG